MRISDWSSDVCSSDLEQFDLITAARHGIGKPCDGFFNREASPIRRAINFDTIDGTRFALSRRRVRFFLLLIFVESHLSVRFRFRDRSEEHTSELQSLMRISYAVSCLKKQKENT